MAIVARLALLVVVAMAAAVSATALPRSVLDAYYRPVPSAGYVRKDCVHSVSAQSDPEIKSPCLTRTRQAQQSTARHEHSSEQDLAPVSAGECLANSAPPISFPFPLFM